MSSSPTLLAEVVEVSAAVAATAARSAKVAVLAALLTGLDAEEVEPVVGWLTGAPRQGRIGVGWKTLTSIDPPPALQPTITVASLDRALDQLMRLGGPGSARDRAELLTELFAQATVAETEFVRRLMGGELRQGALEGVMVEAVARSSGVPPPAVRRALMLGGRLGPTAVAALTGGGAAVEVIGMEVLRPVQPMLASTSTDVASALTELGPSSVEWKLDGAVFTRNLRDVTSRLPEVVEVALALDVQSVVLDGETLSMSEDERPRSFQDTMARFSADAVRPEVLRPWFFDCLHLDGVDLIDRPLRERLDVLERVAASWRIPGTVTAGTEQGRAVLAAALAAGHEGAMVKALESPYAAGRRGRAWLKIKPVHTLDLVVIAAEWGHGRRRGWLSNLHLGARGDDGSLVMVGKTFKGLTDALLAWQTERFLALASGPDDGSGTVAVRPQLVVEIAVDGAQRSSRYPGGVALRFARVLRYRPDKDVSDADTLEAVQALLPGRVSG